MSGILLFDSGNGLLARLGIAQIPDLSRLKSGISGGPAVQSASANQGKQCVAALY
jgi:hypothetical protein